MIWFLRAADWIEEGEGGDECSEEPEDEEEEEEEELNGLGKEGNDIFRMSTVDCKRLQK